MRSGTKLNVTLENKKSREKNKSLRVNGITARVL
jgi:hypothetical protein